MDRAAGVDSVDAVEVSPDDAAGWDAYAVWRERVHGARETLRTQGRGTTAATRPAANDSASDTTASGWDPLATWHGRVRAARTRR